MTAIYVLVFVGLVALVAQFGDYELEDIPMWAWWLCGLIAPILLLHFAKPRK